MHMLRNGIMTPVLTMVSLAGAARPTAAQPAADPAKSTAPPSTPAATVQPAAARGPAPVIREDVRALHNGALAAFLKGDTASAYEGFLAAWSLQRIPKVAGNLGRTELALGKHCAAVEHLTIYLTEEKNIAGDDEKRARAELTQARARAGALRVDVAAGAAVSVDGTRVGTAPLPEDLCVEPGRRKIEARSGALVASREVDVGTGEPTRVRLDLAAPATPPPPADSLEHGQWVRQPDAAGGGPSGARTVFLVGGLALGGAAVGVGAGLVIAAEVVKGQARSTRNSIVDDDCVKYAAECAAGNELWHRHAAFGNTGVGLLIGGGVVAAASVVVFTVTRPKEGQARTTIAPSVGPGNAGLVVHHTW